MNEDVKNCRVFMQEAERKRERGRGWVEVGTLSAAHTNPSVTGL